jgi:hypothetical protein
MNAVLKHISVENMNFLDKLFGKKEQHPEEHSQSLVSSPHPQEKSRKDNPKSLSAKENNEALSACSSQTLGILDLARTVTQEVFKPYIVLGFDATHSRSKMWDAAIEMQDELVDTLVSSGEAKPMLRVVYYNGRKTFETTNWTEDVLLIQNWMQSIQCEAGLTQIYRVFRDVLEQISNKKNFNISSVTFVGDHVDGVIDDSGKLLSQAKEIGKTTPINILHEVGNEKRLTQEELHAREIFTKIANLSGGHYTVFSHNNYKVMKDLAKVLVARSYGPDSKALGTLRKDEKLSQKAKTLLLEM